MTIQQTGVLYTAEVTSPHGGGQTWTTPDPLDIRAFVAELLELGCHRTHIGDALCAADPEWLER